jgi:hypothetical protein
MEHGAKRGELLLASNFALIFGLKQDTTISKLTLEWPSGKKQRFRETFPRTGR